MVRLAGIVKVGSLLTCLTGLRIGGTAESIEIGGIENVVIKDPFTQEPYIPGSSLKGAMRSKYELFQNKPIDKKMRIHLCGDIGCDVCSVFGTQPERVEEQSAPDEAKNVDRNLLSITRLRVSDSFATDETRRKWKVFGSVEVKGENALDRLTSKANPRWVERVPKDSEFEVKMSYFIFDGDGADAKKDVEHLKVVFEAMKLVEEDYLGGYGSRGYGRVKFNNIALKILAPSHFTNPNDGVKMIPPEGSYNSVDEVLTKFEEIKTHIRSFLQIDAQ